jgi:hypothetical protein
LMKLHDTDHAVAVHGNWVPVTSFRRGPGFVDRFEESNAPCTTETSIDV